MYIKTILKAPAMQNPRKDQFPEEMYHNTALKSISKWQSQYFNFIEITLS